MMNLDLRKRQVETERDVVVEERLSSVEDSVDGTMDELLYKQAFKSHPYRWPVIGWMKDIKAVTQDKAVAFYKRFYAPNNAVARHRRQHSTRRDAGPDRAPLRRAPRGRAAAARRRQARARPGRRGARRADPPGARRPAGDRIPRARARRSRSRRLRGRRRDPRGRPVVAPVPDAGRGQAVGVVGARRRRADARSRPVRDLGADDEGAHGRAGRARDRRRDRGAGGAAGRGGASWPRRSRAWRPSSGAGCRPATAAPRRWANSRPRAAASRACSRAPANYARVTADDVRRVAAKYLATGARSVVVARPRPNAGGDGAGAVGDAAAAIDGDGRAAVRRSAGRDRGRAAPGPGGRAADRREQPDRPARARGGRVALGLGRRSAPPRRADQPGRRVGPPRRGRQVARGDRRRAGRAGRDAGGDDAARLDPLRGRGADAQPGRVPGAGGRRARAPELRGRRAGAHAPRDRWPDRRAPQRRPRAGRAVLRRATSTPIIPTATRPTASRRRWRRREPDEISAHFRRHFVGKNLVFAFARRRRARRAGRPRSSAPSSGLPPPPRRRPTRWSCASRCRPRAGASSWSTSPIGSRRSCCSATPPCAPPIPTSCRSRSGWRRSAATR